MWVLTGGWRVQSLQASVAEQLRNVPGVSPAAEHVRLILRIGGVVCGQGERFDTITYQSFRIPVPASEPPLSECAVRRNERNRYCNQPNDHDRHAQRP